MLSRLLLLMGYLTVTLVSTAITNIYVFTVFIIVETYIYLRLTRNL